MRNLLKILASVITIITFANFSCHDCFESELITISNKSNDTIMAYLTFNYPDTFIPPSGKYKYVQLKPSDSYTLTEIDRTRDDVFTQNGIFQIFIINYRYGDLCRKKGGQYMSKRNLILKRYEFTRKDLEQQNWNVTYPD